MVGGGFDCEKLDTVELYPFVLSISANTVNCLLQTYPISCYNTDRKSRRYLLSIERRGFYVTVQENSSAL